MSFGKLFVAGINYRKTDTLVRGKFAINKEQHFSILHKAKNFAVKELFILSTCNRTEIYGIANSESDLIELLCSETKGSADLFHTFAYLKKGKEAVDHLFNVAAGLDSQILGDYEIIGQIKQAAKFSKVNGFISTYFERLINAALQASKAIKSQTQLSCGTVSVSFAAVQFIKENVTNIQDKEILLIGTGKIGRITVKNLVTYLETKNITLINRSEEKAFETAEEFGLNYAPFTKINEQIEDADIIIVSASSAIPLITKGTLLSNKQKVLIDLSIPNNIESSVRGLSNIILANVDDLSCINDATLKMREAEVPKAKNIIDMHIAELMDWHEMRRHAPVLKAVKEKLNDIYFSKNPAAVQKAVNNMAVKMRQHHKPGCNYIEAINDFLSANLN